MVRDQEALLKAFNTKPSDAHVLERQTYSLLKFNAVPTITSDGRPVTAELAAQCLSKHPEWRKATPLAPPRFVYNKANPNAHYATLQVKVKDTLKATVAMSLLKTSVSFIGIVRRCLPWTVAPTTRQCSTCLKWGHTAYTCKAWTPCLQSVRGSSSDSTPQATRHILQEQGLYPFLHHMCKLQQSTPCLQHGVPLLQGLFLTQPAL